METKFFFLLLTPTIPALDTIISKIFPITYNDNRDLGRQQNDYETRFRINSGSPTNYNSQWSPAYDDQTTVDNDRNSKILSLKNAGENIRTPDWP